MLSARSGSVVLCDVAFLCCAFAASDFVDILVTSLAELPGIVITAALLDRFGRRYMQAVEFGMVSVTFWLLVFAVDASKVHCVAAHAASLCRTVCHLGVFAFAGVQTFQQVMLFIGRATITGAFAVTIVYTPEVH